MIQSFAVGPVRRKDVSMWKEQIKHPILFIFLSVIDPTLTLQSNTNKAKRERAREKEKKKTTIYHPNKPEHSTAAHTPNHCMSHVQRESYTRVSPRQHDDYKKGFQVLFNQTKCDKQTIPNRGNTVLPLEVGAGTGGRGRR